MELKGIKRGSRETEEEAGETSKYKKSSEERGQQEQTKRKKEMDPGRRKEK